MVTDIGQLPAIVNENGSGVVQIKELLPNLPNIHNKNADINLYGNCFYHY